MLNPENSETEYVGVTFIDESLTDSRLEYIEFDGCIFKDCDFSATQFYHCKFIECEFIRCNLSVVEFMACRVSDVSFIESKVIGVDWTKVAWPNLQLPAPISFQQSVLNDSSFFGLYLTEMNIVDCKVNDVDFREGDFSSSVFSGSDLANSLFSGANLTNSHFENAENYYIDINSARIKGATFSRVEAVSLLESLDIELVD